MWGCECDQSVWVNILIKLRLWRLPFTQYKIMWLVRNTAIKAKNNFPWKTKNPHRTLKTHEEHWCWLIKLHIQNMHFLCLCPAGLRLYYSTVWVSLFFSECFYYFLLQKLIIIFFHNCGRKTCMFFRKRFSDFSYKHSFLWHVLIYCDWLQSEIY